MFKTLVKDSRDVLLGILQDYFSTDPEAIALGLQWNEDPLLTKIFIADRYPDEIRKFPCIVVRAGAGGNQRVGFRNFAEYSTTDDHGTIREFKRYTGKWHVPFTYAIASRSGTQRDQIIDLVIQCLDIDGWETMQKNGVEQEPDSLSCGGDETFFIDKVTPIEKNVITGKYFLEWFSDREVIGSRLVKVVLDKTNLGNIKLLSR